MDEQINQEQLKELLHYDPETGVFRWKGTLGSRAKGSRAKAGDVAGSAYSTGYVCIRIFNKVYYAHRLAWLYTCGEFPEDQIDHINGLRDDNRIINLRAVTQAENARNLRLRKSNTSGYIGVGWDPENNKWKVQISKANYGRFKSKSDAIAKAKEVYKKLGYHKNHGKRITANG